jgi:hypothetical protein
MSHAESDVATLFLYALSPGDANVEHNSQAQRNNAGASLCRFLVHEN